MPTRSGRSRSRWVARVVRVVMAFGFAGSVLAQPVTPPSTASEHWEPDIRAFEAQDATSPPPQGAVLFIGSSSIRMWTTLADDFPQHQVINRGFGGSQIPDSTHFVPRIVLPYHPRLIVMYAGANDINDGRTPQQVAADFRKFVETVRLTLPTTRIAFISIAGNPARWPQVERVKKANALVRAYAKRVPNLAFIDVFPRMLGPDGQPRPELFIADRLHMNKEGYRLWTEVVAPYLEPQSTPKTMP